MGQMGIGHQVAWGLRAILGIGALYFLVLGNLPAFGILLLSIGASGLVYYLCRHFLGQTGQYMDVLFTLLVTFNNLFGLAFDFYHTVPGWDVATHYTTSIFLAVSALILLQKGYPQLLMQAPKPLVVTAVILFSLGLGGLWEIGEFLSDFFRATDFQHGLLNTMQDLIVDLVAGIVVGVAWVQARKN